MTNQTTKSPLSHPTVSLEDVSHVFGVTYGVQQLRCAITGRQFELPIGAPALTLRFRDAALGEGVTGVVKRPGHDALVIDPAFAATRLDAIQAALRRHIANERRRLQDDLRFMLQEQQDCEKEITRIDQLSELLNQDWAVEPICDQ